MESTHGEEDDEFRGEGFGCWAHVCSSAIRDPQTLLIFAKKRAIIIKEWDNALLFSCNTNNTRCNFKIHTVHC
jgi:hypothetical protein